jgi:hypothetical protein
MRPPSVGTLTVAVAPLIDFRAASPMTRVAGTWAGSVPVRDDSRDGVPHRFIAASQEASPWVVVDQAVTNAVATATGEPADTLVGVVEVWLAVADSAGVVRSLRVVVAAGTVGTDAVRGGRGAGAAEAPTPLVRRPRAASRTRARTAVTVRLRHDHSGHRTARPTPPTFIPRLVSAGSGPSAWCRGRRGVVRHRHAGTACASRGRGSGSPGRPLGSEGRSGR